MNKMTAGISTASFFNKIPTENTFAVLRDMGVSVTEVFLNTYSEYEKDFTDIIKEQLGGIGVHSIHVLGTQFEPELFNKNARVKADAERVYHKVLAAANALGAGYYTFHGPLQLKKWGYSIDYDFLAERLYELNAAAKDYGVKLSYENVHWAYGSTPEFFYELIKRYPQINTTLDIKQAILGGCEPESFLEAMGKNISTVHICDVKEHMYTALPGKGDYNFEKLFAALSRYNLSAPVLIECYSRDYNDCNELKNTYGYIRSLMDKHGLLSNNQVD